MYEIFELLSNADETAFSTILMFWSGIALFFMGLIGIICRSNLLAMIMCLELTLNGVNLSLVAAGRAYNNLDGAILAFIIFVVSAAEIALAIPIILLLIRQKKTLDSKVYSEMKG